jgi:putative ABC transport system permease protein
MRGLRAWLLRLAGVFQPDRDRDLDAELESHLQLHIDDGMQRGLSADEARRQAVLKLGGIERTREQYRDRRGLPAFETLARDVRYAVRVLRQRPGFTLAAVLVLALGIGANTAIFSVVNAVLLRPLPYPEPDRLTFVWHVPPADAFPGMTQFAVSPANFLDWQRQSRSFERMALMQFRSFNISGQTGPETLRAAGVTPGFFEVLGVQPILGRTLRPEEDIRGQHRVVVLSERLWTRRFGGDPNILGRKLSLGGEPFTVVGIMGPRFRLPQYAELWTPLAWTDEERAVRNNHNATVIARLRRDVDLQTANTEITVISRRLEQQYPEDNKSWGAVVIPLHQDLVADIRPSLMVLLGAVAFVLLIACANVANLVLARTIGRRKEIGVRLALGASGGRVLRQILCETAVLGVAGGVTGLLVASAAVKLIVAYFGTTLPEAMAVRLDLPVLAFTLLLSLATGIVVGASAAWRLTHTNVSDALKQGLSRTDADYSGARTRNTLVVAEVALSLMLLIGAGLMVRSLYYLQNADMGMDPRNVLAAALILPQSRYDTPEKQTQFYDRVLERIRALPGVETASLTAAVPLSGDSGGNWPIAIEGRPTPPVSQQPTVVGMIASPGFLQTLRIGLVSGRDLADSDISHQTTASPATASIASDTSGRPTAILISQSMAKHFWPNQDPLGARLKCVFLPNTALQVVGVVKDAKIDALDALAPRDVMYLSFRQLQNGFMQLMVRTTSSPLVHVGAITKAVHELDPEQPVVDIRTMDEVAMGSISRRRFTMLLLASFAGLALVLAAVGIYSVLSYAVRQRVREIGIRLALGAQPSEVLRMMVVNGMRPTLVGVVIGVVGAAAISRLLSSFFFGISGTDPATFAAVAALVLLVGFSASLLPAYRATLVDPIKTLRDE